ncbi:26S proteasome non-ATPase regulatory subunit 4 [Galdieria sulphuraria]|nr:26S proteasome non-ATPase regulatory subunit 4 [Galdieria sulphuraria]
MVLEAVMVCVDNSEWMRNGDYPPSRLDAQQDAANLVCGAKLQQNPENTVGLMTMAGGTPEILVTQTQDIGVILSSLHGLLIRGKVDLKGAILKAQLALKHRQNKVQRQRLIVFVGSYVDVPEEELVSLGRRLKKNNVALDIVSFGECEANESKLEALIEAVNSNENSHLLSVLPGPHILSDIVLTSPIVQQEAMDTGYGVGTGSSISGQTGGGASDFEFGVDPNVDPELAMALRISMEEEKSRQEALSRQQEMDTSRSEEYRKEEQRTNAHVMQVDSGQSSGNDPTSKRTNEEEQEDYDDEEEELQKALKMSLQDTSETKKQP